MSIYCKNCGIELNVDGQKIAVCDFCGMEQTLPTLDNPEKLELFAKANEHRIASRFDIAKKQYESIIAQYPEDNEAYWCKLLCVYGIEYVDDDLTEKKIPTCHRTITESIFDNSEYKLIMSRASAEEKAIYEAEAKEIDRIQKEILSSAQQQEPFDVFICYKESDNNGSRTKDSQIANRIYANLTSKGYKVFYSRVTLKELAGSKYEPIIYSALTTAKVMLVVTTSKDYVNAPWVRNEWSRYLEFMQSDYSKSIVPCISVMDAYDLPEELAEFQALNTADMDFTETLTRQIDSKFGKEMASVQQVTKPDTTRTEPASSGQDGQINNFINRAKLSLSYNDWAKANELAEKCLDIDYKCAEAYVIKLMCDFQVNVLEEIVQNAEFLDNVNYKQALQFADEELRITLVNLEKPYYYNKSKTFGDNLLDESVYNSIKECLEKASGYKDADKLLAELPTKKILAEKKRDYELAQLLLESDLTADENYKLLKDYLTKADDYKDAKELLESLPKRKQEQIDAKILAEKKKNYDNAIAIIKLDMSVDENYNKAKEWLTKADDYKDAKEILKKITAQREEFFRQQRRKKKRNRLIVILSAVAVILIATIITVLCIVDYNARDGLKMVFSSDHDYYTVIGIDGKAKSSYKIPSTYKGKPVGAIDDYAFANCSGLTSVEIPDSDMYIGEYTFSNCPIETATIPTTVISRIPKGKLKTVVINGGKTIGNEAFLSCSSLTSIEIHDSVTSIGDYAFSGCSSLTSIEIPNSVTSIGASAFSGCSSLTSIEIPNSVTSIGASAFYNCSSLTSIEIPNSVTSIGGWVFSGCKNLTIYCEAESQPSGWHIDLDFFKPSCCVGIYGRNRSNRKWCSLGINI